MCVILQKNNAMIARADNGNSIVILPTKLYESKIQDFLHGNNFITSTTDPTNIFQKEVRNTIKESNTLIPKDSKWKYINLNPSAPSIKELIKLHKPGQPIRPVVNWHNAPAYKLSKLFTHKINGIHFHHKEHHRSTPEFTRHPDVATLNICIPRHYKPLLQHPDNRDQDDPQEHTGILANRSKNTTGTFNVV